MRIAPKDITLDALDRNVICKALDALIAKERARIRYLTTIVNPVNAELSENTIAHATDLLELFKN